MSIKFLPYAKQRIEESDIDEVTQVLRSELITQGPKVPAFENAIKDNVNAKHAIAVNSATSALHIACLSLGLKSGDWLWTSPITFVASANCALYCRAKISFVDIELKTGLISLKDLSRKLRKAEAEGCLPKILIPIHYGGASCNMREIKRLSQQYGFSIIEDASHAIGGSYENQPVGSCKYSDITVFSFHPVKIITTGEGGVATTNHDAIAEKMSVLRNHGVIKDNNRFQYPPEGDWAYEQQSLGFNYRMSDIQAALGISQLKKLKRVVIERNKIMKVYKNLLVSESLDFLDIPKDVLSTFHLAVIKLKAVSKEQHREFFTILRRANIGVQVHYIPVHRQPYYRELGFKEGDYPKAEAFSQSVISIPMYEALTIDDQKRVVKEIQGAVEKIM